MKGKKKRRPAAAGKRSACASAAGEVERKNVGMAGAEGCVGDGMAGRAACAPGRPRAYETAEELLEAVERYFDGITRTVDAAELVDSGRRDDKGHVVYESVAVRNDAGEIIRREEFVIPPSVTDLCLCLGISRQTWTNYAADEAMGAVIEWAKARMQGYLERELLTRQKGLQGVIFNLQNNYDWKEKRDVTVNEGLEAFLRRLEEEGKGAQEF